MDMHKFKLNKLCCLGLLALSGSVLAAATEEGTVNNSGTFTYTQKINSASTAPHYTQSGSGGFGISSGHSADFGWQHSFAEVMSNPLVQIQSATLLIRAYDVDSEAFHGLNGEYDGISVDGVDLNPGLLQGTNGTWSETSFDLPISSITDDGLINTFVDIDMNAAGWITTLDYSLLTITYMETSNLPPSTPVLSMTPSTCTLVTDDLVVGVTGPTPADPDGDSVTYSYRWFVDIGQGSVVDDEVAGKTDHTGNTVLAAETVAGETWRVQVTATDSNGLSSDPEFVTWEDVGVDCDQDGVTDANDDYPTDPDRAFNNYSTQSTLVFEDLWPDKGDYDLNDFVLQHTFNRITNAAGQVKEVTFTGSAIARGASYANAFAISFPGTDAANVESSTFIVDGSSSAVTPEAGHTGETVMVLFDNIFDILPAGVFPYYNSQNGDDRALVPLAFTMVFTTPVDSASLGSAPFNPFIYRVGERGREIHLVDQTPTDLVDVTLLGTGDDATNTGTSTYYQTASGHPFALNVPTAWSHPYEYIDVLLAYPQMQAWAESNGVSNPTWYNFPSTPHCWKC